MEIKQLRPYGTPPVDRSSIGREYAQPSAPLQVPQPFEQTEQRPTNLLSIEEKRYFLQHFNDMKEMLQEYFIFNQSGKLSSIGPAVGTYVDVKI